MAKNAELQRWQAWLQDGRLATVTWFCVFAAYIGFRIANINAPEITNAFVTITGIWVGNLGISQTKKKAEESARVEMKVDHAVSIAETAKDTIDTVTGELPPLIQDADGNLRPQEPPRIARGKRSKDE